MCAWEAKPMEDFFKAAASLDYRIGAFPIVCFKFDSGKILIHFSA